MQNSKIQFTFRQKTCSKQAIQKFRFFPFTFNLSLLTCHFWRSQDGQSLVEILIAIGLVGILLPALLTGLVSSREGKAQEGQRLQATALVRESEEAVRSIREKGWANISTNGTYDVAISGSEWTLTPCPCPQVNGFSRQVVISDAKRDANGNLVESGGTVDPSTKKVTVSVSWSTPFASSVESTSYYQRYLGNTAWDQTTDADFAGGAFTNTEVSGTGQAADVRLTQSVGGGTDYGNKFRLTATSAIGTMTTTTTKTSLRFTAQEDKTANAIRVYLQTENRNSPAYRYGIQSNNPAGNIPSGTWLGNFGTLTATSAGWKTITLGSAATLTAGTIYHIVIEPDGTPSNRDYIDVRRSFPLNNLHPKTNASDPSADTLFTTDGINWTAQGFQPIYELDSGTTYEGNPYESNTEVAVFGSNFVGEKFTFVNTDQTSTDIAFYVRRNGNPAADLDVELLDINAAQTFSCSIPKSQIATSYSYQSCSFNPAVTLKQNTDYRVYLKSPGSASGKDYRLQRINTTNSANFNSITYDGTNSIYTVSTNSGSTWSDSTGANPNWDVGGFYFTVQGTSTYSTNGTFESHASGSFDAGAPAAFNNITWTANVPVNTTLQLQAAVSASPGGPWDYFGADGNSGSYFPSSGPIPLNRINGRYLRYKATFTSNGSATPTLNDVSINYSP